MRGIINLILGAIATSAFGFTACAQTSSPPPDYPNVQMQPDGFWMSDDVALNGDSVAFVFGVDLSRYVASALSDDLAGGNTEQDAVRVRNMAFNLPLMYSLAGLESIATTEARLDFQKFPSVIQVSVRMVIRTGPDGGPLQEHFVESFTCTQTNVANCVIGTVHNTPGFINSPWFLEQLREEADHLPPVKK